MADRADRLLIDEHAGDAVLSACFAYERVAEATTLPQQADAFRALADAMSDLMSWVPGYNMDTGRIEGYDG